MSNISIVKFASAGGGEKGNKEVPVTCLKNGEYNVVNF